MYIPLWVSFSNWLLLRDGSLFQISLIKFLLFSVHSPSNVLNCSSSAEGIELGVLTLTFLKNTTLYLLVRLILF